MDHMHDTYQPLFAKIFVEDQVCGNPGTPMRRRFCSLWMFEVTGRAPFRHFQEGTNYIAHCPIPNDEPVNHPVLHCNNRLAQ